MSSKLVLGRAHPEESSKEKIWLIERNVEGIFAAGRSDDDCKECIIFDWIQDTVEVSAANISF